MAYPFAKMTTKKLNSYFDKHADTNGKKRKQTSAARNQPVKKTETNCTTLQKYATPGDSE